VKGQTANESHLFLRLSQEIADFVAPDVSDDGVAYCIEKLTISNSDVSALK